MYSENEILLLLLPERLALIMEQLLRCSVKDDQQKEKTAKLIE